MPELCRFYGIIIRMFWADHPPPHFHAVYGENEAIIDIRTSEVIEGSLPLGAGSLVNQWIEIHRSELLEKWELARNSDRLVRSNRYLDGLPQSQPKTPQGAAPCQTKTKP